MKKMMKRLWANEKGFTLIELIIVIAILAIISAIAVPNILTAVDNSRKTVDVSNAKIIADAVYTVRAKVEKHAGVVGMYNFGSGVDFEDDVFKEMSNVAIVPKYKGAATWDELNYIFTINDVGAVVVYTTKAAVTHEIVFPPTALPTDSLQVFPTPATPYQIN